MRCPKICPYEETKGPDSYGDPYCYGVGVSPECCKIRLLLNRLERASRKDLYLTVRADENDNVDYIPGSYLNNVWEKERSKK
jgi:hypothetical protein